MEKFQVINPADETVVTSIELTSLEETDRAINRAHAAFPKWRAIPPGERAELLRNFARNVEAHKLELADLEIKNSGHTRGNALWEVGNVVNTLNYYSAAPERLFGKQIPVPNGVDITFKEPIGVVGVIVPWNFPMPIAGWGFAPALAAGNTVVLKPAEYTPLTAIKLVEIAQKSGIPADVFQVLPGKGSVVGNRFVTHPLVRKIVFTGSTAVGQQIMSGCADQIKRVTLELGGKNANIIFADADIERAASAAPYAVFDNAGQDCCARTRILVQKSVFDNFMAHFERAVKAVRVEDPNLETAEMGPLISKKQLETVQSYLDEPVAFTGTSPQGKGFWMAPTVLLPKNTQARSWQEEVFGPVVSVLPFDNEADAIEKANDTEYGLSGSIWSNDIGRALRV
ncbi:MAG: aldehyde dehydrogenase, partial [Actinobacteria bacterium]|nr:aldehyde dehydrogenase [Candidatus Fonsibacter lacus]